MDDLAGSKLNVSFTEVWSNGYIVKGSLRLKIKEGGGVTSETSETVQPTFNFDRFCNSRDSRGDIETGEPEKI